MKCRRSWWRRSGYSHATLLLDWIFWPALCLPSSSDKLESVEMRALFRTLGGTSGEERLHLLLSERLYSLSATKTAVVRAGTVAVPSLELKVDCLVAGSLDFRCTGCRCRAKPSSRLLVKVTDASVALKTTTMCL